MSWEFIRRVGLVRFVVRFLARQALKRLFRVGVKCQLPTGLTLLCPPWSRSGSEAFYSACDMDWGSERLCWEALERDGTFLDIGAHIGYYALYMAPGVRRVHAFEPDPRAFAALCDNLAAVDHAVPVPLAVLGASDVRGGGTSIDAWMAERPAERVTAIKVDVDGADLAVVAGGVETIRRDQPLVLMEVGAPNAADTDLQGAFALAESLGFRIYGFARQPGLRGARFRRLNRSDCGHWLKMVFLAPRRLWAEFDRRAESGTR